MEKIQKYKMDRKLLQGLLGVFLSATVLLLPVTGRAAGTVSQSPVSGQVKPVMPQEQIYLDKSQAETARKQKEADAYYNSNPQNHVPAAMATEQKAAEKTPVIAETPLQAVTPDTHGITYGNRMVRLHHFGVAREFATHHVTVADVLKDMNINMEGRTVYPAPETTIEGGMDIHVLGRKSFVSHEEVEIPFQTKVIEDPELEYGTRKVATAGVKGKDIVTYENITRTGYEQKIELARRHVVMPTDEVVRQGVAQSILTPNGYVKYKKVIYGEATAYTWGGGATGMTSIGLYPKRGIVAVDPRVIPYYTKMYIPGYGFATAGDTGGAIVGHRIDLFMDSLHECYQWGRRDVEIYILE